MLDVQVYEQSYTCPRTYSNHDIYCDANELGYGCLQLQLIKTQEPHV